MKKEYNRLYNDLAWIWPIWEDVEEYRYESELFIDMIKRNAESEVRTILDIGCGGGKNVFHLKKHYSATGIDISDAMLSHARKLNPECEFVLDDMRRFDLGRQFDSIFINDSINYMTTRDDLQAVFRNAHKHLKPNGVMICFAEVFKESFIQNKTHLHTIKGGSREITIIENYYSYSPEDETQELTLVFLIRQNGELEIEYDFHIGGLFPLDFWRQSLHKAGFEFQESVHRFGNDDITVFTCNTKLHL